MRLFSRQDPPAVSPTLFMLDEFGTEESREQIFGLIESAIIGHGLQAQAYYFVAERRDDLVRVMWFPRSDIDCIASARETTLAAAVRYVAREARRIFSHSWELYDQGIKH